MLLLLGLGGKAWAGKPQIAILGLEVIDNGSGIDPDTTKAAKDLTNALRDRAKAGTGPYTAAPGGDKELIDEKLLKNCDSEASACMAAIGAELGAEVLLYGRIEKSSQNGQATYKVSVKLLNVPRKQLVSSAVEVVPISEASGVKVSTHAKNWYGKLVGVSSGGTLVVKANIDRGTVLLDEDVKGNLSSGAVTISGVAEGRHTLAIEAKDYQRYETQISIRDGETLPQNATLLELPRKTSGPGETLSTEGTIDQRPKSNFWKPAFYASSVLEVGSAGFLLYSYVQMRKHKDNIHATGQAADFTPDDCGRKSGDGSVTFNQAELDSSCKYYRWQKYGGIATGLFGVAMIGTFVMAFVVHDSGSEGKPVARNGGRKKKRELAITPVVTPDGGGATLQFDW